MNLFTNLYNDKDEILEWLNSDKEANKAFKNFCNGKKEVNLEDLREWLLQNEELAQSYREYHFGKQWNLAG